MINGSELIKENSQRKNISSVNSLFKKSKFSKVKLVRIASHFSELHKVMPVASKIKSLGYKVAINLMQISDRTENEIQQFCVLAKKNNMDAVYFADSTGSLNRDQTLEIIKIAAKNSNIVGADINELSPIKGFNSYNFLVAKLAYKILSYKFLY